jgi:alkanesulfonate monooxygenase SsuD/methylene tetrahydromethanopterin reductase-like flavin-dependent oxidoreductase (luciferase family)
MVMFGLRYDLRNPAFAGTSSAERFAAALDMAAWADDLGGLTISISEHHRSEDGYLPSPIVLAAAIAGRTRNIRVTIAALLAPLYDPIRLAEDLAVLDAVSGGRVDVIVGAGYVAGEFEMFGVSLSERATRVTEVVETLRQAWTGEEFVFRGRSARVTPKPAQPGGPPLVMGGSSAAAARRAARIGDGFLPVSGDFWPAYREEMIRLGKPDPGDFFSMGAGVIFVARDPETAWADLMPYFLHESNAYGEWLEEAGEQGPYKRTTAEEIRAGDQYRVVAPDQYVDELRSAGDMAFALLQPMVGGVPPALAWESLRLFESEVLPALG